MPSTASASPSRKRFTRATMSLLTDNSSARSTSARTASPRRARSRSSSSSGAFAPTPSGGSAARKPNCPRRLPRRTRAQKKSRSELAQPRPSGFAGGPFCLSRIPATFEKIPVRARQGAEHTPPPRTAEGASPLSPAGVRPEDEGCPHDFESHVPLPSLPRRKTTLCRTGFFHPRLRHAPQLQPERLARVHLALPLVIPLEGNASRAHLGRSLSRPALGSPHRTALRRDPVDCGVCSCPARNCPANRQTAGPSGALRHYAAGPHRVPASAALRTTQPTPVALCVCDLPSREAPAL